MQPVSVPKVTPLAATVALTPSQKPSYTMFMVPACALTAKPMTIAAKANLAFPKGDRPIDFISGVFMFLFFPFVVRANPERSRFSRAGRGSGGLAGVA